MVKYSKRFASRSAGLALTALASLAIVSCGMSDQNYDTDPELAAFYDRYPIKVEQAEVKAGVNAKAGVLGPEQINAVMNFARDARANAESTVMVKWSSGSPQGRKVASEVARMLVEQGVPARRVKLGSYSGGADAPLQISYLRKVAVTKECGDWSDNLNYLPSNGEYRNFGCSHQHNIAAMVANPNDFEEARQMSPAPTGSRVTAMTLYYTTTTTTGSIPSSGGSSSGSGSGG